MFSSLKKRIHTTSSSGKKRKQRQSSSTKFSSEHNHRYKKTKNHNNNNGDNNYGHTVRPRPILTDYTHNRMESSKRLHEGMIQCDHFDSCPGCIANNRVGKVRTIQSAQQYFSSTAIQNYQWNNKDSPTTRLNYKVVVPSPVTKWRTQAKLVVAPKSSSWSKDGCQLGLYQKGTHTVLGIPHCEVHHPSINRAVDIVSEATTIAGISAYEETTREGSLRYVQFQVERTTGKVCLTLVWNAEQFKQTQAGGLARLLKTLQRLESNLWHSIWVHCNDGLGNNIFSRNPKRWHKLYGPEFLREPLPIGNYGWLYFTPLTFRQGNMDGFDILATDVAKFVPGGSKVCELYAGVGVLGLSALAYHAQPNRTPLIWLRCSDENPSNPRCFQRAVDSLPSEVVGVKEDNDKAHRHTATTNDSDEGITIAELMQRMQDAEEKNTPQGRHHDRRSGAFDRDDDDNDEREDNYQMNGRVKRRNSSSSSSSFTKKEKTKYMVASASKALLSGQALGANVLIVDPPRKGLDEEVLTELCKPINPNQPYVETTAMLTTEDEYVHWANDVTTLIYVSCGFDALARDTDQLLFNSHAGWKIHSVTGYVLFPGSDHVETICVFKR